MQQVGSLSAVIPDRETRVHTLVVACALGALAICWILLTPPGAGPDEASHLVRAGGVVHGQAAGDEIGQPRVTGFDLSDRYFVAEPGCYAFQPEVSVACSAIPESSGADAVVVSTAGSYPVWFHLVVGAPTVLPGLAPIWWARLAGAAVVVAFLTAAVVAARRRSSTLASAVLLALTPMAWFTFAIVNPSSMAIAGAVALWVGLLIVPTRPPGGSGTSQLPPALGWLIVAGWAAVALPRRDGLIWACLILVAAVAATGRPTLATVRSMPRTAQVFGALVLATVVAWGLTSGERESQLAALAPLLVVGAEVVRRLWLVLPSRAAQAAFAAGSAVVGVIAAVAVMAARPGGADWPLARRIVGETSNNLIEAVGVLGWLDTNLPWLAVVGWFVLLGLLAAAALLRGWRSATVAAAVVASAIATSWIFELFQGNTSGTYWQGRYSLPLLVGVPILLAFGARTARDRSVGVIVGVGALVVVNVAAWAAARRFGVGVEGSLLPWDWDTSLTPLPPVIVLGGHAVASVVLALALLGRRSDGASEGRSQRSGIASLR